MSATEYAIALRRAEQLLEDAREDSDRADAVLARSFIRLFDRAMHSATNTVSPHPDAGVNARAQQAREALVHDLMAAAESTGRPLPKID